MVFFLRLAYFQYPCISGSISINKSAVRVSCLSFDLSHVFMYFNVAFIHSSTVVYFLWCTGVLFVFTVIL